MDRTGNEIPKEPGNPELKGVSRELPFAVPPGYFELLEAYLVDATRPALDDQPPVPFTVPEGYFEKLPYAIRERLPAGRERRPVRLLRPAFGLSLAAVCLLLFLLIRPGNREPGAAGSDLSYEDLSASGYLGELDEDVLIHALEAGTAESIQHPDADIEEYLIENHVDLDQLTNEL